MNGTDQKVLEQFRQYCKDQGIVFNPETQEGCKNFYIQNKEDNGLFSCLDFVEKDKRLESLVSAVKEGKLYCYDAEKDELKTLECKTVEEKPIIREVKPMPLPKKPGRIANRLNTINPNLFRSQIDNYGNALLENAKKDFVLTAARDNAAVNQPFDDKTIIHEKRDEASFDNDHRSKHMKSYKLGSVRQAVLAKKPNAYQFIDKLRTNEEDEQRKAVLHHGRAQTIKDGQTTNTTVLKFDIAGSGFAQFRAEHRGFHGKSKIKLMGNSFDPNKSFEEQYSKEESDFDEVKKQFDEKKEEFEKWYGKSQEIKGKSIKDVRMIESKNAIRYNLSSSQKAGGALDQGDYSISNDREYILELAKKQLTTKFSKWKNNEEPKGSIHIMLRGHSRGGVASSEAAMMINAWVHDNYPDYEDTVKYDLTQYDPVPGGIGNTGVNQGVDLLGDEEILEGETKFRPLGNKLESTVIYSMHSDRPIGFTPQTIKGAKRIILTPFRHNVGLNLVDRSETRDFNGNLRTMKQGEPNSGEKAENKLNRQGYTDARTGEVYMGNSINDLDEGVYILDEDNTLIRMDSAEEAIDIYNSVISKTRGQWSRHNILRDVTQNWFEKEYPTDEVPQKPIKPVKPKFGFWKNLARVIFGIKKYKDDYAKYENDYRLYKTADETYQSKLAQYKNYFLRRENMENTLDNMFSGTKQNDFDQNEYIFVNDEPLSKLLYEDYANKLKGNNLDQNFEAYKKTETYKKRAMDLMLAKSDQAEWRLAVLPIDTDGELKATYTVVKFDENTIKTTELKGEEPSVCKQARELNKLQKKAITDGVNPNLLMATARVLEKKKLENALIENPELTMKEGLKIQQLTTKDKIDLLKAAIRKKEEEKKAKSKEVASVQPNVQKRKEESISIEKPAVGGPVAG